MCTSRRHSIPLVRCYPALDASRVHASAPTPPAEADPGSRSYLDFAVVAEHDGPHRIAVTYDHRAPSPLALGFALDGAQTRTVRYPPLAAGTTHRTSVVDVEMRRGPGVIRLAEGPEDARLHVHSLRVTRIPPREEAEAGTAAPIGSGASAADADEHPRTHSCPVEADAA
ncbi:hypothetical protein [Clavibacter capsici]|uniref:hypothetical protein n=1 Tax=Clavibacter capsici TaxID=1874630 RepID=UPI0014284447|nr:hypothetical protein [Clavibacter capsici]QIS38390.1 hypothetical protein GW572_03005 [Clavibacter capsici]